MTYLKTKTTCQSRTIITVFLAGLFLVDGKAYGKDGFGLDEFKRPAEVITKPTQPYRTKFGNPIHVYTIKNSDTNQDASTVRFLIQGGLHGNELLASEYVGWLAKRFAKGESLLNTINSGNVEIDFIPFANPDGTIQFTRYNGNKINLNRNFGVLWGTTKENPGPKAFSESETRAIRDLLTTRNYAGSIDVHGYVNWVVIPTSPNDGLQGLPAVNKTRVEAYEKWRKSVERETTKTMPGYQVKTAGALGDGGAFEDYAWWGAGVPSACLEVFSEERYIAKTLAGKVFDWITPGIFTRNRADASMTDTFLIYESYMHGLFMEALKLRPEGSGSKELAGDILKK